MIYASREYDFLEFKNKVQENSIRFEICMLTTLRNLSKKSIAIIILLNLALLGSVLALYYSFLHIENDRIVSRYKSYILNYNDVIQRNIEDYLKGINYAVEYQRRFSIYNSTIVDYVALSSEPLNKITSFISNIRAIYNVSLAEVPLFEERMVELEYQYLNSTYSGYNDTKPSFNVSYYITELDTKSNKIVPVTQRDWYCPLLFVTPIDNTYFPGLDLCALRGFKIIDILFNLSIGDLAIAPRLTPLTNEYLVDMVEKTQQGFISLTVNVTGFVQSIINFKYAAKLVFDNETIYDDCKSQSCDNGVWESNYINFPGSTPDNQRLRLDVLFTGDTPNMTQFLYIVIALIIIYIFVFGIIINYEFQKSRYIVTNKMLGYVNHELRNPLNCINGFIELSLILLDEKKRENNDPDLQQLHSDLSTAQQACTILTHIVNDILDIARIKESKLIIHKEKTSVQELLNELQSILLTSLNEKPNIRFQTSTEVEYVYTDRTRLLQILLNFTTNAIKFTETGSIVVSVTQQGDFVKFAVTDTGIGIEKKDQHKIFKPFEHVNIQNSLRHGGLGLGLVLCKELIDLLGGTIGFRSAHGYGSSFWVELPVLQN